MPTSKPAKEELAPLVPLFEAAKEAIDAWRPALGFDQLAADIVIAIAKELGDPSAAVMARCLKAEDERDRLRERFRALAEGRTGKIRPPGWSWPSAIHDILDQPTHRCPRCGEQTPGQPLDLCPPCDLGLANDCLDEERERRETAEAERDRLREAIERVRRLCQLTIDVSCRVQAIEQAHDTLAVLDQPTTTPTEDFYEDDEPVEDVKAAFDSGEKGTTG